MQRDGVNIGISRPVGFDLGRTRKFGEGVLGFFNRVSVRPRACAAPRPGATAEIAVRNTLSPSPSRPVCR